MVIHNYAKSMYIYKVTINNTFKDKFLPGLKVNFENLVLILKFHTQCLLNSLVKRKMLNHFCNQISFTPVLTNFSVL